MSFPKTFNGLFSNARKVGVSSIILTVSDLIIPTVAKLEPFYKSTQYHKSVKSVFQDSTNKKIKSLGINYVSLADNKCRYWPEWLFERAYWHHCTERSCFQNPLFVLKLITNFFLDSEVFLRTSVVLSGTWLPSGNQQ